MPEQMTGQYGASLSPLCPSCRKEMSHVLLQAYHNLSVFLVDDENSHIQCICTIHAMSVVYIKL